MDFLQISEYIYVYKNCFEDVSLLAESFDEICHSPVEGLIFKDWRDWFTLGKTAHTDGTFASGKVFEELQKSKYSEDERRHFLCEQILFSHLRKATTSSILHYLGANDIVAPEPNAITLPNLCIYDPGSDHAGNGYAMNFHTDWNVAEWWQPGRKYLITCTAYLNDDYGGGEIVFFINGELLKYKPEAGDVLVFPSGDPRFPGKHPFFHGVRQVGGGRKMLVRTYLEYYAPQNIHFWYSCQSLYGKQKWDTMVRSNNYPDKKAKNILYNHDVEAGLGKPPHHLYSDLIKYLFNE